MPGAWSSRWKAELVLILRFDCFPCLKRQEAAEATWMPFPFWNPSFLQDIFPPPTLRSWRCSLSAPTTSAVPGIPVPGGIFSSTSCWSSSHHQKSRCRQSPEGTQGGCSQPRLSHNWASANIWDSEVYPTLRKEQQNMPNNSTSCQEYCIRWMLQHANKDSKF